MRNDIVEALRARRPAIRQRWQDLLRAERPESPLANPEALVHLIDWTMNEVERALRSPAERRRLAHTHGASSSRDACRCPWNPFLLYFAAAEQAWREALILTQVELRDLTPNERELQLTELNIALHVVAEHEIGAFCGMCQYRDTAATMLSSHSKAT